MQPAVSPTKLQARQPQERVLRAAELTSHLPGGIWPFCAVSHHRDAPDGYGSISETRSLAPCFTGDTFSVPLFLEKVQFGRNPCAPAKLPPTYLLPSRQFPGTLHFPDVSSFVAVSSYQREVSLRRCLKRCPTPPLPYRLALVGSWAIR